MTAAAVGTDVLAADAAAFRALPPILEPLPALAWDLSEKAPLSPGGRAGEKIPQNRIVGSDPQEKLAVDAAVVHDAVPLEIDLFGAGRRRHSPSPTEGGDPVGQVMRFGVREIAVSETGPGQTAPHLSVSFDVGEAEDQLFRVGVETLAEGLDSCQKVFGTERIDQDEGIEAPDHPLPAEPFREGLEGRQPFFKPGDLRLQSLPLVVVQGVLQVESHAAAFHLVEALKERSGVFRPEDDGPDF